MMFVDSHAHLDEIEGLDEAIDEAKTVGVVAIIAVGCDPESNEAVKELARRYLGYVYPAFGLHPWDFREDGVSYLEANIDGCIALGEVGLDYRIDLDKKVQIKAFRKVLELASRHGKPVIIHARDAWMDAFKLVHELGVEKAVFHWFSGPLELLDRIVEAGYYVSATPAVAYQRKHRMAIARAPLSRILLETDSPVAYRGVPARPRDVIETANGVAALKGIDMEEVAARCVDNAEKFFNLKFSSSPTDIVR